MGEINVLVTGAAGAVGRALVGELLSSGRLVTATDLPESALPHSGQNLEVEASTLSCESTAAALIGNAQQVVHLACLQSPFASQEDPSDWLLSSTRALYHAARHRGVRRFLFIGSGLVYRSKSLGIYRETDPLEAAQPRHKALIACESLLASARAAGGPEIITLRPALIYGPDPGTSGDFLAGLGPIMTGLLPVLPGWRGGPRGSWIHSADLARAATHLLDHGDPDQAYNIADDDAVAFGDLIQFCLEALGLEPRFQLPYPPLGLLQMIRPLLERTGLNGGGSSALRSAWERICRIHDLKADLQPVLDPDLQLCASRESILLNDKLRQSGFAPIHPSIKEGWPEILASHQHQGWLPTY